MVKFSGISKPGKQKQLNPVSRFLGQVQSFKVDIAEMQKENELAVKSDKRNQNSTPLNVCAEQTIHGAVAEAKTLKSKKVEPEHLILSILNNSNTAPTILDHIRHTAFCFLTCPNWCLSQNM